MRTESEQYELQAAVAARDEAIEIAAASVATAVGGPLLVERVTALMQARATFTGDDIADLLDEWQVPRDLAVRRRVISTVVSRGRGRLWDAGGTVPSRRRNATRIVCWVVRP